MVDSYDKKSLVVYTSILVLVMAAMWYTDGYGFALVIPLVFVALMRGKQDDLIFFLVLTSTIVVGNNNLMPKNASVFIMQRGILALLACVMSVKVLDGSVPAILKPFGFLLLYLVYMTLPSAIGWCPLVSFLKLILFCGCFLAYFGTIAIAIRAGQIKVEKLRSIFLSFAIFYILGSVFLIPFPSISQLEAEKYMEMLLSGRHVTSLFMGMTNMSQCLGPVTAAMACLLFGDLLFGVRRVDKLYLLLLACCPILVYKTSSRTALGTLGAGLFCVVYFFMKERGVGVQWKSRVLTFLVFIGLVGMGVLVLSTSVRQKTLNFIVKWGGDNVRSSDINYESVYMTRQGKIDEGLYNFKQSPMVGNGFQVGENMRGLKARSIKDLLSAPVEKGVWVSAVLEEGGVLGMILFLIFLLATVVRLVRLQAYVSCSVLITFVVANLGEFMFFSMSYMGGFMWAVLFLALAFDGIRIAQWRRSQSISWGRV